MSVRKRKLPYGWYPDSGREIHETIEEWLAGYRPPLRKGIAGVAPHAGWSFSGRLASKVFACMSPDVDTVVVAGGHLPSYAGILAAPESGFETPMGTLKSDDELLDYLKAGLDIKPDRALDNTVEVQLPFVKHFFGEARVLYIRVPPSKEAVTLGEALCKASAETGRRIAIVGSTDLTHYGPSYGFEPRGTGPAAEEWVREENDRPEIDLLLEMKPEEAVKHAELNRSACSAGGAACAAAFARKSGIARGTLVGHTSSLAVHASDSFVGYAGIIYSR